MIRHGQTCKPRDWSIVPTKTVGTRTQPMPSGPGITMRLESRCQHAQGDDTGVVGFNLMSDTLLLT